MKCLTWTRIKSMLRTNVRYVKRAAPFVTRDAVVDGGLEELERMRNLGRVSAARLRAVGIATPEDLKRVGAIEAYVRLRRAFPAAIKVTALYALHGAVTGVRWYALSEEIKAALRDAAARRL